MRAAHLSIALETGGCDDISQNATAADWAAGLWRCVEMHEPCFEAAMATEDGRPLIVIPPPGGKSQLLLLAHISSWFCYVILYSLLVCIWCLKFIQSQKSNLCQKHIYLCWWLCLGISWYF